MEGLKETADCNDMDSNVVRDLVAAMPMRTTRIRKIAFSGCRFRKKLLYMEFRLSCVVASGEAGDEVLRPSRGCRTRDIGMVAREHALEDARTLEEVGSQAARQYGTSKGFCAHPNISRHFRIGCMRTGQRCALRRWLQGRTPRAAETVRRDGFLSVS